MRERLGAPVLDLTLLEQLARHPAVGGSWEGYVIEMLHSVLPPLARLYFYRTNAGAELPGCGAGARGGEGGGRGASWVRVPGRDPRVRRSLRGRRPRVRRPPGRCDPGHGAEGRARRAMSKYRCLPTPAAMRCISSSGTARCSAAASYCYALREARSDVSGVYSYRIDMDHVAVIHQHGLAMREHRPQPPQGRGRDARPERRDVTLQTGADEISAQRQTVPGRSAQGSCPESRRAATGVRAARERLPL